MTNGEEREKCSRADALGGPSSTPSDALLDFTRSAIVAFDLAAELMPDNVINFAQFAIDARAAVDARGDANWKLRCASRFRAFEEAMQCAEKIRGDRRRWMDDSWQEAARFIRNEIYLLQEKEVAAVRKQDAVAAVSPAEGRTSNSSSGPLT